MSYCDGDDPSETASAGVPWFGLTLLLSIGLGVFLITGR